MMELRPVAGALAGVFLVVGVVLLLLVLGLLWPLVVALGVFLLLLLVVGAAVVALLALALVPYYYLTKRPRREGGSYRLEDVEEK